MPTDDEILAEVIKKLQKLASERIQLERNCLKAGDVEEEGSPYRSEYIEQEQRFGCL